MSRKLSILLIFENFKAFKLLMDKYRMHNLHAIVAIFLNICKQAVDNLVNESKNVPRKGVIHSFDLTKTSVHDIHLLKNVKVDYSNCTLMTKDI